LPQVHQALMPNSKVCDRGSGSWKDVILLILRPLHIVDHSSNYGLMRGTIRRERKLAGFITVHKSDWKSEIQNQKSCQYQRKLSLSM
jgi:hypothetical protein